MRWNRVLLLCLLYLIGACAPTPAPEAQRTSSRSPLAPGPAPTDTPSPPPTGTAPTSPTAAPSPSLTATRRIARWKAYQNALSSALLASEGTAEDGLCEWEVLGQDKQEVYVWAMCQIAGDPEGAAVSAPCVLRLGDTGNIRGVEVPRDGELYGPDVRDLFPEGIQQIIFNHDVNTEKMWQHIQVRHQIPQPPLIVQRRTPIP